MDQQTQLANLAKAIRNCTRCPLHETRIQAVPGRGHTDPWLFAVGEFPGEEEDRSGLPFVGKSGVVVDMWVDYLGLEDDEWAISNLGHCKPPNNRDPRQSEIDACAPWLKAEVRILKPEIILTIGRFSTSYFLGKKFRTGITKYGGKFYEDKYYPVPHPSYFLRHGKHGRDEMWKEYFDNLLDYMDNPFSQRNKQKNPLTLTHLHRILTQN